MDKDQLKREVVFAGLVITALAAVVAGFLIGHFADGATAPLPLDGIRQAIKESDAEWIAGHTKFSTMDREQRAQYFMQGVDQPPVIDGVPSILDTRLPNTWDWTDHLGVNWMTPVRDQGACGSCWAFAALGAVEGAYRISIGDPSHEIDLSEQFILSCVPGGCEGGVAELVMMQLLEDGVPEEVCCPYTARVGSCDSCCSGTNDALTIADWRWLSSIPGDDIIKKHLKVGPVITSMVIHTDLLMYKGGVYEHVTGETEGLHAVTLVGWNDERESWKAKNSWGTDWGKNGYLEIKRGDSGIGAYALQPYITHKDVPPVEGTKYPGCGCGMVY